MLVLGGALIPLDRLPAWMADIGRLTPIAQGVIALRAALIDDRSDFSIDGDGGLLWLLAVGGAYVAAGIVAFTLGEWHARRHGSLGHY